MTHGLPGYWRGCRCDECRAAKRESARTYYLANREATIARAKAYAEANADRVRETKATWYARNREKIAEAARSRTEEERAARAARERQFRIENPGRMQERRRRHYERHRESIIARAVEWRRSPAGKAYTQHRRGVPLTDAAVSYVGLIAADPCVYCGGSADSVDHIEPISAGGTGDWDNLAPACRSCNASKKAKPLLTYLLWRIAA
jgi:5-methylcytosine-specific restriction endonuclease McrA